MKTTDFSKYLSDFLGVYLPRGRNMSSHTISSYCDTFSLFLRFCRDVKGIRADRLSLADFNSDLVTAYLKWIETDRKCSVSTRNQRLAAICSFVRYVQIESPRHMFELQKILAIPFKKAKEPVVSYLSADELKLLLEQPDTSSIYGRRDLVMLSVLYDTGARVQELVDLTVRNIRLENPAHITLTGKGDKSRQVPLLPKTVDLLRQYLAEMNLRTPDKLDYPVFTNNQKKKFTRAGVAYLLDKYAKMARTYNQLIPEKVTPHMLRHTKAMHLLQADVNIIYIRDILGHVDVATTGVYARADTKMKRAALEKADDTKLPSAIPPWAKDQDLLNWLKNLGKDV